MSTSKKKIPEGYMEDHQGKLVPEDIIPDIDRKRDELVRKIVAGAQTVSDELSKFKESAMEDVRAFVDISGRKYGVKKGGKKGNVQLLSYDGRYKVVRAYADIIIFDERLQVAKQLLDEVLHEWAETSVDEIKVLINDAFQVDKAGNISVSKILNLRRKNFKHTKWKRAMDIIGDSMQVIGSKPYLRIYERVENTNEYKPISLDIAGT